ncbi:bifunctional phosphoribosylaminoimidazolecarboxamide formyltransferase/IMP cyclohydrolase [Wolbachia endosymbiont of Dirofilaria (Dirofilaria) immitis]|uniref:bifunctional phosphoribosylaminoimidazolecarboxamide formyltransferase/IMP cyclohydrolase n=1 Tax=Wolbachia endosymbiont of Dirofilaria (Dirofilaria) immitis TaxID=1812115 RepID=UPI00158B3A5C|nr:bifunctional phosphoribosylaminoimidazolecarboxamide formyltransferase/IMP cyclohydrolase [Wolbachia endosymbiont of Dirofilaria (Dirofilaria) immitis]QKX02078.1 bifunctional phosphoribosylaminoimidazolecarboxamide formyltransferase/IMP cyclohydrolase [Wolbachia endosymbiont of Dirofilaria (Dirofilaria) immitis]
MYKVKRALISVYDKTNIIDLASFLVQRQIKVLSTGNTYKMLSDAGIKIQEISDYTQFPEVLDGRVKTLHPKVHGGILCDREKHREEIQGLGIEPIDLLIINLYPFWETVSSRSSEKQIIEQIDIGGVALIRAAAKNFHFTSVISSIQDYETLKVEMIENNNETTLEYRKHLATKAFALAAYYDSNIYSWFLSQSRSSELPEFFTLYGYKAQGLRYGENPHQKAAFYSNQFTKYPLKKVCGKELSYNNILDVESALNIVSEFEEPTAVIIKHNNPCGVAVGNSALEAYEKALSCDEISSFGGIVALNRAIDLKLAEKLSEIFLEVVIMPSVNSEALKVLQKKKNLRVVIYESFQRNAKYQVKNVVGGFLVQESNNYTIKMEEMSQVTRHTATKKEKEDLIFAWKICKHVKSNAIVIAKSGCTVGIGAGQTSRIDSVNIAVKKAGERCKGAVLASDAFFPFPDSIIEGAKHGVTAIIQPGGSLKDQDVIAAANESKIAMFFTGIRSFFH